MHFDAGCGEALHRVVARAGKAVAEHFAAQLRVCGMDGDIHRGHLHFDDARDIVFVHVGQGYVVAHQEGEAGVVVLEVKRLSHSRRELVDEAENALIAAGALFVHEKRIELKPDIVVSRLFYRYFQKLGAAVDEQAHPRFGDIIPVIEDVVYVLSVDTDKVISALYSRDIGGRARQDVFYKYHFPFLLSP
ncbi:unknown [Candidatus Colimorpha enterica]|uniref:Uncharacterized protein n=1 Tax=Candidatus Colimorpha enterica TaxID=3083063 RepID=R6TUS9_9BACT|nr:unknown [Candidatus Colimorpha enterica]